jgi:putative heme-binding domain-containing protein
MESNASKPARITGLPAWRNLDLLAAHVSPLERRRNHPMKASRLSFALQSVQVLAGRDDFPKASERGCPQPQRVRARSRDGHISARSTGRRAAAGDSRAPCWLRLRRAGLLIAALIAVIAPGRATAQNTNVFDLRDGDRVVLIGDTLIERELTYGHIEYLLTTQFHDRNVTFRNFGWSGDTPLGQARVGFDHGKPPEAWFQQLTNSIAQLNPTVVFLGYGMAGSFAGEAGLSKFGSDLDKLMDAIQQNAGDTKIRWVLLSPVSHEKLPPPLADPATHNAQLAAYTKAIKDLAARRAAHFINLFDALDQSKFKVPVPALTDNGLHLNDYGYRRAAEAIRAGLKWDRRLWRYGITPGGKIRRGSNNAEATSIESETNKLRMNFQAVRVELPAWRDGELPPPLLAQANRLQLTCLLNGQYDLFIDGQFVKPVKPADLVEGVIFDRGPAFDQADELLQAIRKKNELFFHRWRPQNNTYLFLFRKHEQGQNAREIPQFDPLIEEQEKKIAALRKPRVHRIEVLPSTGDAKPAPKIAKKKSTPIDLTPMPHPQWDVDPNLEISLYAENPLLAKPIHMNFDERGRLWVASSEVYPQIKPGQEATDKIIILEDTDGDGRSEKSTIFADGLLIPTGILPGDGGAYIGASTELLHMKDTDGDGVADQRRVVLSAFGTEDTHHILHTLRWGHDGHLYMNQSIYIHTHAETPHGVIRLNSGGILNLRVPTMELGIHMKGLVNSWGHAIDDFGQSFATDGASSAEAGQGGLWHVVPQAMYFTYAGARRILQSASPGSYPKFAGLEYVRSPHFPDDWQGNYVTCDFRAHRIVRFAIDDKDSSYVTREMPDLVRTKDVAFRPIDIKLGPDGALYIADWSNPIIQHGEVDFRDPRRDHEHGRIWRVSYKGRKIAPKQDLAKSTNPELLANLTSKNLFTREQSKRLLTERGAAITSDLAAWTKSQSSEPSLLEALWMYQSIDVVEPKLLEQLLNAKDGKVRAAAVRVLAFWQERLPADPVKLASAWQGWPPAPLPLARAELPTARALELLAARVADDHPRVRLEAVRALARIPTARAAELALSVLDKSLDPKLDYALWLTINDLAEPWLAAVKSGAWKAAGREKQLEFALKAIEPAQASDVLSQLLGDKPLPKDGSGPWIELIGQAGTAKELRKLFDQVLDKGFEDAATARALASLDQAARLRNVKPDGNTPEVGSLFNHASEPVRLAAVRLAGGWKNIGKYFPELGKLAGGKNTTPALREAAFATLRDIGGQGAIDSLTPLTAKGTDAGIRRQAVLALAALRLDKALPAAVEVLTDTSTEADALALWRSLLSIKGAAPALAKALPKSGIPPVVGKAGLRAAREGGRSEPDLVLAITRGSGLDEGEVSLSESELKQLVADVQSKGDPARGEIVYRRKELSCVACHAIGGAGGKVGPDMTSIGASAQVDYLIESVWFPNKKIKEGYHAVSVETKDNEEYSGVLVRESNEQIILRDATGREITVAKNNVADRRIGTLSLMPAGLIDGVLAQERIDLFRFLSELGKPGAYDATKGNIARAWRVRTGAHTDEQSGEDKIVTGDLSARSWFPLIANVNGTIPSLAIKEAFPANDYQRHGVTALYLAAQLQTANSGPVQFRLAGGPVTAVWIDGKPQTPGAEFSAQLAGGTHTIVVRVDPKKLPESLRLESSAGTFATN